MYHKMGLIRQKICEYVVSVSHSMVACRSERPCLQAWLVALYHYYNVDSFSTIINKMGYVCLLLLGFVCPLHSKNMWILSGFSIEYKGIWPQSFHNFSPKFNVLGKRSVIHKVPLLKSHQYYCSMNQYLPRWVVGDPLCVKLESYFFFYFWRPCNQIEKERCQILLTVRFTLTKKTITHFTWLFKWDYMLLVWSFKWD